MPVLNRRFDQGGCHGRRCAGSPSRSPRSSRWRRWPAAKGSRPTPTASPGPASKAGSPTPPPRPIAATPMTPGDGTGLQVAGHEPDGRRLLRRLPLVGLGGFRATSGVIYGSRTSLAGMSAMAPASGGLLNVDRRLFGASATGLLRHRAGHRVQRHPAVHRHRLQQPGAAQRLELQRRPGAGLARPGQRGPPRPGLRRQPEPRRRRPRHEADAGPPARRLLLLLNRSAGDSRYSCPDRVLQGGSAP